jgi:hypothetical protein
MTWWFKTTINICIGIKGLESQVIKYQRKITIVYIDININFGVRMKVIWSLSTNFNWTFGEICWLTLIGRVKN